MAGDRRPLLLVVFLNPWTLVPGVGRPFRLRSRNGAAVFFLLAGLVDSDFLFLVMCAVVFVA